MKYIATIKRKTNWFTSVPLTIKTCKAGAVSHLPKWVFHIPSMVNLPSMNGRQTNKSMSAQPEQTFHTMMKLSYEKYNQITLLRMVNLKSIPKPMSAFSKSSNLTSRTS